MVRALCDSFPPLGTRDLARRTETDPGYVSRVLDLLDREDLILVGAQAIYLHTGEGDLAVAPYTTDADLASVPADLLPEPGLQECLEGAGFRRTPDIGIWGKQVPGDRPVSMTVDLLVPELLGARAGAPPGWDRTAIAWRARSGGSRRRWSIEPGW